MHLKEVVGTPNGTVAYAQQLPIVGMVSIGLSKISNSGFFRLRKIGDHRGKAHRLSVGCGRTPTVGYLNLDNSFTVRIARWPLVLKALYYLRLASKESLISGPVIIERKIEWADATKYLPVPDESASVVYSSHMLEHLDHEEAVRFLAEARRVLVRNGIVRFSVPDLRRRILQYVQRGDADSFMESLNVRSHNLRTIRGKIRMLLVGDRDHRWMYDAKSLCRLLDLNGFTDSVEVPPGVTQIESPGDLNLREREDDSIYVEARKP